MRFCYLFTFGFLKYIQFPQQIITQSINNKKRMYSLDKIRKFKKTYISLGFCEFAF